MTEKMKYHNGYYFFVKRDDMARRVVSMNRPEVVIAGIEPPKKVKPVRPNTTQRLQAMTMNKPKVIIPGIGKQSPVGPVKPNARKRMEEAKGQRTYASEMELALDMARTANHDRNPNRAAEVNGWLDYGLAVGRARRSHAPMPPRPERKFV